MKLSYFIYLSVLLFLNGCGAYFFYPDHNRIGDPASLGIKFQEINDKETGKPSLIFWILEPQIPYKATILFLHGNAENMSTHMQNAAWLTSYGYQVVMFDYRGYGGSEGSPDIAGVHEDSKRAVVFAQKHANGEKIILYGQSIGASIALTIAADPRFVDAFSKIIAEAPFSSYSAIAQEKLASVWLLYPFQWIAWLLVEDSFSPIKYVDSIQTPVLLVHGSEDTIVSFRHSEELCNSLKERCALWKITSANHMNLFQTKELRDRLSEYLFQ